MYHIIHIQHQFLSFYSRLNISALIACHILYFYFNVYKTPDDGSQFQPKHIAVNGVINPGFVCDLVHVRVICEHQRECLRFKIKKRCLRIIAGDSLPETQPFVKRQESLSCSIVAFYGIRIFFAVFSRDFNCSYWASDECRPQPHPLFP